MKKQLEEIKKQILDLPTEAPDLESDMYDRGLKDMQEAVIRILNTPEKGD